MFKTIFISFFLGSIAFANVGFQNGNHLDITTFAGHVSVFCRPSIEWRSYNCFNYTVDPESHDYFQHPPVDADKVILTAIHEDGSTKTKKEKFNSETGLSKQRFNLAIRSLLQRPLLHRGVNTVDYTLTKNREVVSRGSFEATVNLKEERQCPDGNLTVTWDKLDCQYTSACREYFRKYNWCK